MIKLRKKHPFIKEFLMRNGAFFNTRYNKQKLERLERMKKKQAMTTKNHEEKHVEIKEEGNTEAKYS